MNEKSVSELLLYATMLGVDSGKFSIMSDNGETRVQIGSTVCWTSARDLKICLLSALHLHESKKNDKN